MKKLLILVLITCLGATSVYAALPGALAERFPNSIHGGGTAGANAMLTADPSLANFSEIRPNMRVAPDVADNYNGRLTAWLVPPVTGDYQFMIASDDQGRLWLSSDENPANATRIAYHDAWTGDQDWNEANYPTRVSAVQSLEANKLYWIRAGFAEGGGGDNLSVAWRSTAAGVGSWQVIPGDYLIANIVVEELPTNLVSYEVWDGITLAALPDFSTLGNPSATGTLGMFGVGPRAGTDNFAFRQYGILSVDTAQTLGFGTVSDDGSKLYVGNWWEESAALTQVVNNDGLHGNQWRQGTVGVDAGYVGIVVEMFKAGGGDNLEAYYWSPTVQRKMLNERELIAYNAASAPSPFNGQENVPVDAVLSWHNGFVSGAPLDVYFGEAGAMTKVVSAGDVTSYDPDLEYGTIYNWRVDVTEPNEGGTPALVEGTTWAFKTVTTDVVITTQPTAYVRADAGDDVTLSVAATSALMPLEYQWKKGDENVGTGATLVIEGLAEADQGVYTCVVSNGVASATSAAADVKVKAQIAYYPLNEDLADPTGAGPTGTYFADEGTVLTFDTGVVGNAIAINIDAEHNEYVAFGVPGDLGIFGEAPRTIACWAKNAVAWDQMDDWQTIFGFTSTTGTGEHSFDFDRRGGQNQYCIHRYGAEWNMQEIDGEWHFLVASFANDTIYWYVDGVYGGTATTNLQTQDILHLGKRAHSAQLWRGYVDEARVFNYAITPQQVADLYAESGMAIEGYCAPNVRPAMDFNGDCVVDELDLIMLTNQWLLDNTAK
ncbi:MAG: immunoglobulin domain-containing protein [Sedimentisphaerales bacterium]|nr:immunoglobulin domain-containing protein [Sedimentisphaerales bacterium]